MTTTRRLAAPRRVDDKNNSSSRRFGRRRHLVVAMTVATLAFLMTPVTAADEGAAVAAATAAAAPKPTQQQQQQQQQPQQQQQQQQTPTTKAPVGGAPQKKPTCADVDGDGNSFCSLTPGYKLKASSPVADPTLLTISNCCERDDSRSAFGACDGPASAGGAGQGAVQAPTEGDTSWLFQDSNAFSQTLDRFTGLCFSVLINPSECASSGDPLAAPRCCTRRPPAALQFKLATADAASVRPGSKRAAALANLAKCNLMWAPGSTVNVRGLKRIGKWEKVAAGDKAQYFNVPTAFPAQARQATFCLYTNGLVDSTVDCSWESICGIKDDSVPLINDNGVVTFGNGAAENDYAQGCEVRLVGRKAPSTSQCCSPPMSLVSFESPSGADDDLAPAAAALSSSPSSGGSGAVIRTRRAGAAAAASGKKKSAATVTLRRGRLF